MRRAGALDAEIKQLEPKAKDARDLLTQRAALEKEVNRLETLKAQSEATLGSLGSIRKISEQLDQVLLRLADSLGRVDRAAAGKAREQAEPASQPAATGGQP